MVSTNTKSQLTRNKAPRGSSAASGDDHQEPWQHLYEDALDRLARLEKLAADMHGDAQEKLLEILAAARQQVQEIHDLTLRWKVSASSGHVLFEAPQLRSCDQFPNNMALTGDALHVAARSASSLTQAMDAQAASVTANVGEASSAQVRPASALSPELKQASEKSSTAGEFKPSVAVLGIATDQQNFGQAIAGSGMHACRTLSRHTSAPNLTKAETVVVKHKTPGNSWRQSVARGRAGRLATIATSCPGRHLPGTSRSTAPAIRANLCPFAFDASCKAKGSHKCVSTSVSGAKPVLSRPSKKDVRDDLLEFLVEHVARNGGKESNAKELPMSEVLEADAG